MLKKLSLGIGSLVALALPVIAFAQTGPSPTFGPIGNVITNSVTFMNNVLVPLVFAIAFLFFIWGMFKFFILSGADEDGREAGKQLMMWGIVAFVLMVSIWGIVNVVAGGLGFRAQNIEQIPNVPRR